MEAGLLHRESAPPAGLTQAEHAHELGTDGVVGAEEHHQGVVLGLAEHLKRPLASRALGQHGHVMDPNALVLLGFVVAQGSVEHLLPQLAEALATIRGLDDGGDEMSLACEGVHHQEQARPVEQGQGALDAHGKPLRQVAWVLSQGSVPWTTLPGEVGCLPLQLLASPRIGAWLNHAVCVALEGGRP